MSAIDETRLHAFVGKMLNDLGAAAAGPLIMLGDRMGLFVTLSQQGPLTSAGLAEKTGFDERYLREWLAAMAASEYITYDAETESFSLSPEQDMVFANPQSPVLLTGGYYGIGSMYFDEPKIAAAFRTGDGVSWGEHHECLFCGTAKFFRPGYATHLVNEWIPALEGVSEKLTEGGKVADIGCGHGCSTTIMAQAFPNSEFTGFDYHEPSVHTARKLAKELGIENVSFEVASASNFPGEGYDLVTVFDALHDMGDPAGASRHVLSTLKPDGSWMIVEPMAGDTLQENLSPVGRAFYCFSTMICTPASKSQEVGLALGAQAGEKRLREVIQEGGFSHVRRATETPFNMILEARP